MNGLVLVWVVVALALCWSIGAYKRLTRLRWRGLLAFTKLQNLLEKYVQTLNQDFTQPTGPAQSDLLGALEQFSVCLKSAHSRASNQAATQQTLQAAFETLSVSWSRFKRQAPALSACDEVTQQIDTARTEFNATLLNYNEAIHQFPALLLARMLGFKPAQPL